MPVTVFTTNQQESVPWYQFNPDVSRHKRALCCLEANLFKGTFEGHDDFTIWCNKLREKASALNEGAVRWIVQDDEAIRTLQGPFSADMSSELKFLWLVLKIVSPAVMLLLLCPSKTPTSLPLKNYANQAFAVRWMFEHRGELKNELLDKKAAALFLQTGDCSQGSRPGLQHNPTSGLLEYAQHVQPLDNSGARGKIPSHEPPMAGDHMNLSSDTRSEAWPAQLVRGGPSQQTPQRILGETEYGRAPYSMRSPLDAAPINNLPPISTLHGKNHVQPVEIEYNTLVGLMQCGNKLWYLPDVLGWGPAFSLPLDVTHRPPGTPIDIPNTEVNYNAVPYRATTVDPSYLHQAIIDKRLTHIYWYLDRFEQAFVIVYHVRHWLQHGSDALGARAGTAMTPTWTHIPSRSPLEDGAEGIEGTTRRWEDGTTRP